MIEVLVLSSALLFPPLADTVSPPVEIACSPESESRDDASSPREPGSIRPARPRSPVALACSGVNCGCDIDQQWCLEDCPPPEDPNGLACRTDCARAYIACARACCEGW